MEKPIQLDFTYNSSNKSTYVQVLENNNVKLRVDAKISSLKYIESKFVLANFLYLIKGEKELKNKKELKKLKVLILYNTNNISLSTLFNLLKRVDKDSKLNSFKVLNEFSLESGLITFEETSINYVQKITN
tara:strand:+ start:4406 stop:4798 length:393 start_codon:yes stop_codon:yes gene_type:complete